jgi:hypothetical protein
MASNKKKKDDKKCPPIPDGFTLKMTGPAWRGENSAQARRMWYAWLRDLDAHAVKMPRRTH